MSIVLAVTANRPKNLFPGNEDTAYEDLIGDDEEEDLLG